MRGRRVRSTLQTRFTRAAVLKVSLVCGARRIVTVSGYERCP